MISRSCYESCVDIVDWDQVEFFFFFSFYKYIYYIIYYNIYSFSFLLHDQVSNEIEQFVFFFLRNELILLAPNRSEVKLPNNP